MHFHNHAAFKRFSFENIQDRHFRNGADKLIIRELLYLNDIDLHEGAQLSRKVRCQIAGKVIMNPCKASDMILGETHGPFEIIRTDFLLGFFFFKFVSIHFTG
ncbi:hypothetical protein D3C81_1316160 [compost metagenome]